MTEETAAAEAFPGGPICPNCREPLRGNLRQQQIAPRETTEPAIVVTYCGSCGWTLRLAPAQIGFAARRGLMLPEEVALPPDGQTPEGQFQLRCRELISETRSLGFDPNVWVSMINRFGAVGAAQKLLADHQGLAATPWLLRRGRPELTMEHEIGQQRWAGLFADRERAEAARRLAASRPS